MEGKLAEVSVIVYVTRYLHGGKHDLSFPLLPKQVREQGQVFQPAFLLQRFIRSAQSLSYEESQNGQKCRRYQPPQ